MVQGQASEAGEVPQRPVRRLQEPLEIGQDEEAADLVVEVGGQGGERAPAFRGVRHRGQTQVLHLQPGRSRGVSSRTGNAAASRQCLRSWCEPRDAEPRVPAALSPSPRGCRPCACPPCPPPFPPHLLLDVGREVGSIQLQGLHQPGVPGQQFPDGGEGAVVDAEPVADLAEAGLLRVGTAWSAGLGTAWPPRPEPRRASGCPKQR